MDYDKDSAYIQIWACVIASMGLVQTGMILGYPAVALPAMQKQSYANNTIHLKIGIGESTWIASLATMSTPVGCLITGPIMDRFGRTKGIQSVNLPSLTGWLLIAVNPTLVQIYIGRLLCGFAIGLGSVPSIVYTGEIATKCLRGPLLVVGLISLAAGVILVYLIGMILQDDWQGIAGCGAFLSFVTIILNLWLPESPIWLLSMGRQLDAENALRKLRSVKDKKSFHEEFEELQKVSKTKIIDNRPNSWLSNFKNLFQPEAYKPFLIMNTFFLFQQLVGISVTIVYAINFAEDAGVNCNFYIVALAIGFIRLLSTLITTWASKMYGRRQIAISTGIGTSISLTILAFYLSIHGDTTQNSGFSWFPIIFLFIYVLMSCVGYSSLPWAMIGEVYPTNVRGIASGLTASITYLNCSIVIKLYPYLVNALGKPGVFFFAGISAILGTIFLTIFLPETRGKSLEEIEQNFKGKKLFRLYSPQTKHLMVNYSTEKDCAADQMRLTKVQEDGGVRRLTLANKKSRNALSLAMMNEILDHISSNVDDSLRCIVISAEGPVFSSGHNLKELILDDKDSSKNKEVFSVCSVLMNRIIEIPVPVIAAVQGSAVAAGCQLVAQCDIAICTEDSTFSTPGSHFGVFCSTPGIPLVRTVPRKVASYMLMTGVPVTAQEALRAGLVSKVVPADNIESEISSICDRIKAQSKSVVALGKKFFYEQVELDIKSAYRLGEDIMVENLELVDGQEGVKSFAEKRKPKWCHNFNKVPKLYDV